MAISPLFVVAMVALPVPSLGQIPKRPVPKVHIPILAPDDSVVPGLILVKYSQADAAHFTNLLRTRQAVSEGQLPHPNATWKSQIGKSGWTLWSVPKIAEPQAIAQSVLKSPGVFSSSPVHRIHAMLNSPNDGDWSAIEASDALILNFGTQQIDFRRLWHLDDINAFAAWSNYPGTWYTGASKPKNSPLVAVIDTGLDMAHPDFINAGGFGIDTASGGQIETTLCQQFQGGQVVPNGNLNDNVGHGTHVAGLALAAGNNGNVGGHGVIGTGYNSRGMILKVIDSATSGTDADAAAAIYYAADNGADVISLSLGTTSYSQLFQDAVTYAFQKGSLVIAAGNESGNGGGALGPIFPAACSGALGVTANGPNQTSASDYYAGTGDYLGIAAPGGDVVEGYDINGDLVIIQQYMFSTTPQGPNYIYSLAQPGYDFTYGYLTGTSMATPVVSGAAGLYYGKFNLHQKDARANVRAYQALESSAMGLNGGWDPVQGYGSLDMAALLQESNARSATIGGVRGLVYYGGTPVTNSQVKAKLTSGLGLTYSTTTNAYGLYRFEGMPTGTYSVSASPFGSLRTKKCIVKAGSDVPGFDFFAGPKTGDTTPPVSSKLQVLNVSTNSIDVDFWGYDTETEIDSVKMKVGSYDGASDIMAEIEVVPDGNLVHFATNALSSGTNYLSVTYRNGNGLSTVAKVQFNGPFSPNNAVYTALSAPVKMKVGQSFPVSVTFQNTGVTLWDPAGVNPYAIGSVSPYNNKTFGLSQVLLTGAVVNPGGSATLNFTAKPTKAGTFPFEWQMQQLGVGFFGTVSSPIMVTIAAKTNDARFLSQAFPYVMKPGLTYPVSVTYLNLGPSSWDSTNYALQSVANSPWGISSVPIVGLPVPPGSPYTFTFNITAPTTAGLYKFQWQMAQPAVELFGAAGPSKNLTVKP